MIESETTDGYDATKELGMLLITVYKLLWKDALSAVEALSDWEQPLIVEDGDDELVLKIQQDSRGEEGV